MKYKYYISLLFLFFASYLSAQNIPVKVVFNNTMDMKQHKALIDELKNSVNKTELQTALNINGKITDKNLKFDIVFFDRNYVGNMKLQRPHVLTVDGYREKWKASLETGNAVLFLFVKEHGKDKYEFEGLLPSKQLEDEHLFEKIVEFINENLKGEHKTIVANGSKYLARAMTPVWTEAKKTAAEQLVQQDKYKAHVISYMHGNFDFTYWDFLPVKECENSAKIWFVNNSNKKDTLKPWMAIYGDTIKFKGIQTVNTFDGLTFSLFGVTVSIDKIQGRILIIEISPHYISIVKSMQTEKKYHGTKSVSEWDWTKANTGAGFSLTSTNGLSDYNIMEDKFALTKVSLNEKDAPHMEGKKMSTIHHSYSNTYCNVYASDLARQILFPGLFITSDSRIGSSDYAPWGAHNRAASLHDAIRNNNNGHFKSVTFDEAWRYTNKGYVVYLTAYNSRYYANNNNSVHPGHIATCYETIGYEDITDANKFLDGKIIQAGGSCGTFKFQNIWTVGNYGTNNEHVKANLYLGYIIK